MRENINDLFAFIAVAADRKFTSAAARLGTSPSSLSRTIRKLEDGLGVRLLTRTTRSVSLTEAGERLLKSVSPHLDEIEAELNALGDLRTRPAGTVRIVTSEYAANSILWPKLSPLLPLYPELRLEIIVDNGLTDIAADRFDAGVRLGESLDKDMIAVRIGPDLRMAVVGSPDYFARHPAPNAPSELSSHNCIGTRLSGSGAVYSWEFEKEGRALRVRPDGQLVLNSGGPMLDALLGGHGIGMLMKDRVLPYLADGRLVEVLDDWCQPFSGFHLYYPSRRQSSAVFALVVEQLRYRGQ